MTTFTQLILTPSDPPEPFTDQLRLAVAAYLARFKGSSREQPNLTCAATCSGAPSRAWTRWPRNGRTWSCTSGGCRRRVCGKGTKTVLVPLPPAVGRAIDRAVSHRVRGPILLNGRGARMDWRAATRRLRHLAQAAGIHVTRAHRHMLRHTYVTTMLDAGAEVRDVQIAAGHADPRTTMRYEQGPQ